MSYESLINALLEEGEVKRKTVLRRAEAEAKQYVDEAKRVAEDLDRQADAWLEQEIARQRTTILGRAALEARHILMQAKHDVLDRVFRRAEEKAMALNREARTTVLRALVEELLAAAPSGSCNVRVDTSEQEAIGPYLRDRRIPFEACDRRDLILGAELETDGAILRTSFASRMAKAKPDLLMELNRQLFAQNEASS